MSRGSWDDPRTDVSGGGAAGASDTREVTKEHAGRTAGRRERDVRHPVHGRDRLHRIRESEWQTLQTVGTFRVVAETDLLRAAGDQKTMRNDLLHLVEEELLDRKTGIVNHHPTRLITLTPDGRTLLNQHREPGVSGRTQQYHAGLVKLKELAHDVQLY